METSNLPSAADVGNSDDSTKMSHEHSSTDAEDGSDGDVESTVAVHQHRMRSVKFDALKGSCSYLK